MEARKVCVQLKYDWLEYWNIRKIMCEDSFESPEFRLKWERKYKELSHAYEKLVDEVAYTLTQALEREGIKYHSLTSRPTKIKTFDSLYEKVKKKKIKGIDLSAIEDIAGVRITCLYRSDLQHIGRIITTNFEVHKEDTSRTQTVEPFGYSSDHYTVKFQRICKGARYDDLKDLLCEIQVRTILMDAWASVSHHLDYKQKVDIPQELRVNFNALAGLFYVADTNFELFKSGVEEARKRLFEEAQSGLLDFEKEIDLDSLVAYIRHKFPNRESAGGNYAVLHKELRKNGYLTIEKIDKRIKSVLPFVDEFEKDLIALENLTVKAPYFTDVGIFRCALSIADSKYAEYDGSGRPVEEKFSKLCKQYRNKIA